MHDGLSFTKEEVIQHIAHGNDCPKRVQPGKLTRESEHLTITRFVADETFFCFDGVHAKGRGSPVHRGCQRGQQQRDASARARGARCRDRAEPAGRFIGAGRREPPAL